MKRALLINWDSYPHVASGGVFTWAKNLIENIPEWEFVILNQLSNPNANADYSIPKNVKHVVGFPIFGTNRTEEFVPQRGSLLQRISRTSDSVITKQFLPLYSDFLRYVTTDECDPESLAKSVYHLHTFLRTYDSKKAFDHPGTWEIYLNRLRKDPVYKEMRLREALINFQVLQRSLQILSVHVPKVDLVHSSLAWLPSLVGVAEKIENNCPFVITEHGVAFRELILYYNAFLYNEASKIFWTVFTYNVVRAIYKMADLVIPVCKANETWEGRLGANPARTRVIYNGVDTDKFRPLKVQRQDLRPTVVTVSRISIFKDVIGLIQAIDLLREGVKDIQCLLFGDSTEIEYSARCFDMVKKLRLEGNFRFMGGTKEPEKAYAAGDVVAFSSITEGFPFAVIEAMACGKAVVATDVEGVREALEGCGILVRSRSPADLARGILRLLSDRRMRNDLGMAGLARARKDFGLAKCVSQYRELYQEMANAPRISPDAQPRQMVIR
jgi:glycosyltransferase involved in cell wall biosynthesis